MTYLEPERLALKLQEVLERRTALRAVLTQKLVNLMTEGERRDVQSVIALLDAEVAALHDQLVRLNSTGSGGTGQ